MEQPLISVIVPVYKVEQYLERCVESIRNQTYQNLEIILVDDGSPDRCGEMCEQFARQDSRIRVVHKENGGLSSARNAGLDIMTGEYVGFVDSDDWIEPEMYELLYRHLNESHAQIATCAIRCDSPDGNLMFYFCEEDPCQLPLYVYNNTQEILRELIRAKRVTNSVCDKLFCSKIFYKLRFTEGIVNEDFEVMPKLMSQVEKLVFVPVPAYHYIMTVQSITRGTFKESRFTESNISRSHLEFYRKTYPNLYFEAVAKHLEISLGLIYFSWKESRYKPQRTQLIRECKNMYHPQTLQCMNKKTKLKYFAFMINVRLYVLLMDLYNIKKRSKCL